MLEQWILYFMLITGHAQNISQQPPPRAEEVYILAQWTKPNIAKREHLGNETFAQCGRYLMRYEIKNDTGKRAMIAFGAADERGVIIKFFDQTVKDIHIVSAPDGTKPFAKTLSTKTTSGEMIRYDIFLPPGDYETTLGCLDKKSVEKTANEN